MKDRPRLWYLARVTFSLQRPETEPHTRRSVMAESTTFVALDQHAATTVAVVLPPG